MKLYFAKTYTLKEDNWAVEIIRHSAEQLPNNEPPGSCPKNKQDQLQGKESPQRMDHQPEPAQLRPKLMKIPRPAGQRYRAGPVSLARRSRHTRIQGFLSSGCTGSRQAAEYRELLPALLRPPNPSSERDRRDSPRCGGASPSAVGGDPLVWRNTKKGQTLRSDLEEAATYSPTGKPQYHRRE